MGLGSCRRMHVQGLGDNPGQTPVDCAVSIAVVEIDGMLALIVSASGGKGCVHSQKASPHLFVIISQLSTYTAQVSCYWSTHEIQSQNTIRISNRRPVYAQSALTTEPSRACESFPPTPAPLTLCLSLSCRRLPLTRRNPTSRRTYPRQASPTTSRRRLSPYRRPYRSQAAQSPTTRSAS